MPDLLIIGPGEGAKYVDFESFFNSLEEMPKVMAFQSYPEVSDLNVFPKYVTWSDPNAALKIAPYLSNKLKILVPEFMRHDYATFRMYCGTTPLARTTNGWSDYQTFLGYAGHIPIPGTTTKYLSQNPYSEKALRGKDYLGVDAETRFNLDKPVFGSVYYDSEQVVGTKYIWGLESKLSSYALPMAHYLGYENVYVCGFGMKGGRFFDTEKTRMPFNDETQDESRHDIPLAIIKKWTEDWKDLHGMNIYSIESDEWSHLNKVMPRHEFSE